MKYPVPLTVAVHVFFLAVSAAPFVTNSANGVSYQGTLADGVEQFQNIFFGQSTSGERRFAPPQPYAPPYNTTINATASGAACPQWPSGILGALTNMSEDCLSLRIARPANTSLDDKLPVMVWIYGGGNALGQIYDPIYTPTGLVLQAIASGQPIIYVAVNYRLNIFGFASSATLREKGYLNAGLKDQRLGIFWVKDNIAAFGGDPDNISIFGESDGATDVGLQLTAYGGTYEVPFHRAIMQSGGPTTDTGANSNDSAISYAAVAALANCTHGTPGSDETLACLRNLSMETLLNFTSAYAIAKNPPFGFDTYFPVVDDDFIPAAPSELIQTGRFYKSVNVIGGWTADDGSLFVPATITNDSSIASFLTTSFPGLTNSTITHILALYPVSDFEFQLARNNTVSAHYYRTSRIYRDLRFTCPSIDTSFHFMKHSNADAWLYELNQTVSTPSSSYLGISHGSDIFYVFNEATSSRSTTDILLAEQMSGNWSTFATTGAPTKATTWPIAYLSKDYTSAAPSEAVINIFGGPYAGPTSINIHTNSSDGSVGMEKLLLRCAFLNSIYEELRT